MASEDLDRGRIRRDFLKSSAVATLGVLGGCLGGEGQSSSKTGDSTVSGTSSEGQYSPEEVTTIVPYATGGGHDAYARIAAPYWEKYVPDNPSVVVKNIVGGGGSAGTTQV